MGYFVLMASVEDRCFSAKKLVNIMDCPTYKVVTSYEFHYSFLSRRSNQDS